jgi:hypothetical protein
MGCWGCRGLTDDANFESFMEIARSEGFSEREIQERLHFFGGFEAVL